MSDVMDFIKVLESWREQSGKTITSVLKRVNEIKLTDLGELEQLSKTVNDFQLEIARADEQLIDVLWFQLCISGRKKLKRMLDTAEKQKKKEPILQKKESNFVVVYPQELTAGKGPSDERMLKYIFKSFVTHYQQAMNDPITVTFLHSTLKGLKLLYGDQSDDIMKKKVISICTRLAKESSRQSKQKMLRGDITCKELTEDDPELYFDQKTRDNIKRIQREQIERMQTGFYDEMKKKINKDASEECRYCRKKNAYCEDQKQIRAADEPMTRFMRCNACEKAWRD